MRKVNLPFIKHKRKSLDITLKEMAHSLGFSDASTYMKYENGEYRFRADHLPVIADKLNCGLDDLFFKQNFADSAKSSTA